MKPPATSPRVRRPAASRTAPRDSATPGETPPGETTAGETTAGETTPGETPPRTTGSRTPASRPPAAKLPAAKTAAAKTAAAKTAAAKSATPRATTPRSPGPKTPTPKTAAPKAPAPKTPTATTPTSPAVAGPIEVPPESTISRSTRPRFTIPRSTTVRSPVPPKAVPPKAVPAQAVPPKAVPAQAVPTKDAPAPGVPDPGAQPQPTATTKKQAPAEGIVGDILSPSASTARAALADREVILVVSDLVKRFGDTVAVDHISLSVPAGTMFGIVGPNGAGKTTTLSMMTGLLRPDDGSVSVHGADVWTDPAVAKRTMGVLPDRLRLFDRLTGSQLLYYAGTLRGLDARTVKQRSTDLAVAFGLEDALGRLVSDYSAGMTKKIALACAMIHSPRLLVLDEPFESVDPVSAANITAILQRYVASGGTVVLSSHSMDLIQRICDLVAIVVNGSVLASGTMAEVRGTGSLEERFLELAGGRSTAEGMEWLHSFSD
jgi:ABC-type multidrug transport system ATPase subunit